MKRLKEFLLFRKILRKLLCPQHIRISWGVKGNLAALLAFIELTSKNYPQPEDFLNERIRKFYRFLFVGCFKEVDGEICVADPKDPLILARKAREYNILADKKGDFDIKVLDCMLFIKSTGGKKVLSLGQSIH